MEENGKKGNTENTEIQRYCCCVTFQRHICSISRPSYLVTWCVQECFSQRECFPNQVKCPFIPEESGWFPWPPLFRTQQGFKTTAFCLTLEENKADFY